MSKMTLQQFASLGGKARAAKLTKKRRVQIAKRAAMASVKARGIK